MRRAERIYKLFLELEMNKDFKLIDFWKTYFDVKDRIHLYKNLSNLCEEVYLLERDIKEINLENNNQFKTTLSSLKNLLEYSDLTKEIKLLGVMNNISNIKSFFEIVLAIYQSKNLLDEDEIPLDILNNFKNMLEEEIRNLNNSDLDIEDKNFFLTFFKDFYEAISLYKISGLDAFDNAIKKNLCKIKVIDEDSKEYTKFKPFIKVSKKILGITFTWLIQYSKKKVDNILEHKITKFIEDKAQEWKDGDDTSGEDNIIDANLEED